MNVSAIVEAIKKKYPGKNVVLEPHGVPNPTEILVEVDPTSQHPEYSKALAVVGQSLPHFHKHSTEEYTVLKGTLHVFIDEEEHILNVGEKLTIKPGVVHYAKGDEAWFMIHTTPGWTNEDHVVVQ